MTEGSRNRAFFALCALLQSSRVDKPFLRAHAAAAAVVETEILPILATAFEVHRELDVDEILELCKPAIAEVLRTVMKR
jgi:hypothetical protein